MLKNDIKSIITANIIRNGDAHGDIDLLVSFVAVTDIAEAAAEDILNVIEEAQSKHYEERDMD